MTTIRETARLTPTNQTAGTATIALITPGKGSSGTYSQDVLETASRDGIFPAGTQMFINHQTDDEQWSQPEGDLTKLAGVLTENARWDDNQGALVAEAKIYSHWRPILAEMRDDIGVSIRADAEVTPIPGGGNVIERITEAISVDFVTKAGRGGRIVELMESARNVKEAANIGQWLESRLHTQFTVLTDDTYGDGRLTREERIALSGALGDALTAFTTRIEADAPQLYDRAPWQDAEPAAVTEASQPPAGQGNTPTRKDGIMPKIEIEESAHAALVEKASRVETTEAQLTEAQQKIAALEAAQAEAERRRHVTSLVEAEFDGVDAPVTKRLLIESLTGSDKTDEQITATAKEAAAEHQASTGAGQVRGLGNTTPTGVTEADDELPTWDELAKIKGA